MALTIIREKHGSSLNNTSVPYMVQESGGTISESAAVVAVLAQFTTDTSLTATDYSFKLLSAASARVTAIYRAARLNPLTPPGAGDVEYGFDFQMQAYTQFISLGRTTYGTGAPDLGGLIYGGPGNSIVTGVRVEPPAQVFWRRYYLAAASVTSTYVNTIGGVVGTLNSITYKGFDPQTLCLVRASGSPRDDDTWVLSFGWGYQLPISAESWGSLSLSYGGFDHAWAIYARDVAGAAGAKQILLDPLYAYTDQVIPAVDHALLGLP
jgi:hypothetical protein